MLRAGRKCGTPTWRMRVGESVGAALAGDERGRTAAMHALELAAVAALERSWETKLFFQEFPQLERMEPDDVAVLEAHGERFRAKHLELLRAIASLLREGARIENALAERGAGELFVSVCAWCNCVRGPERVWIPLDEFVARATDVEVTHGICQSCTADLRSERGRGIGAGHHLGAASEVA